MVSESRPMYPIAPASPHQATSSTTATVPGRSIAATHVNRRLHIPAERKWGMSEQFEQSESSFSPYGVGESTYVAHSSCFAESGILFVYTDGHTIINCCNTRQSSSAYTRRTQMGHERAI